ncbi:beta-ketoacyl-[acyl-carrier-protein] synthase family protein [Streptomyces albireticuli]|nr:beta-ketoacyl-[acyl-carrier-protein] synthase family protein [Streptomyces albireticuli]
MSRVFDAAVTGFGMLTSAGADASSTWEMICRGAPTASTDHTLTGLAVDFSCRVENLDRSSPAERRHTRTQARASRLAVRAAREAVRQAGLGAGRWESARVAVVVGTGIGGLAAYEEQHRRFLEHGARSVYPLGVLQAVPSMPAAHVAADLGTTGPNLMVGSTCASGTTAIGVARDLLRSGSCDVAVAGGAEAALTPVTVAGFDRLALLSRRSDSPQKASRPFDADRDGFVLGEGAGFMVLERPQDAHARRAPVHAWISGYGATSDGCHVTAPRPGGQQAEQAIRAALADADLKPDDIGHVNAHGTGSLAGDLIEARVITRVFPEEAVVTSVKGTIGHTVGASGAIDAVCAVFTVAQGIVPPTVNHERPDPAVRLDVVTTAPRPLPLPAVTSNSFGLGGHNAVLVITAA